MRQEQRRGRKEQQQLPEVLVELEVDHAVEEAGQVEAVQEVVEEDVDFRDIGVYEAMSKRVGGIWTDLGLVVYERRLWIFAVCVFRIMH